MSDRYVIGVDYGTDSVRAVVVNVRTGKEEATEVAPYKRWSKGMYCDPSKNQFRQHPLDYIEGLEECVRGALAKLPAGTGERVVGIGVDTTGSTPCAVDQNGTPLALTPEFADNPNAMFILWKDHTAVAEAAEINEVARTWGGTDFTKYEGGVYSSEWFWAKILHTLRHDSKVRDAAFSWVEHCDYIPALLTGTTDPLKMKRSRCAAGHKAMWHPEWDGLPSEEFLVKVDPLLSGRRQRLFTETYTSDVSAGGLIPEWAERLGVPAGIAVAVGAFDAHMGAVGGGIVEKALVKIMGTSTCDVIVAPYEVIGDKLIKGICGQVDGSVIPGMIGLEAGQSGFGDVYAWFREILCWPFEAVLPEIEGLSPELAEQIRKDARHRMLARLTQEAAKLDPASTSLVALDWLNGRRTPFANQTLKGVISGITLGTTAPAIFRALVEATAFGAKAIVDRFAAEGVEIDQVIALGGIPQKNDMVMQITSDVLGMPINVTAAEQACALGAAMFGAVAAGLFDSVQEAQQQMGSGFSKSYSPIPENVELYKRLYQEYLAMGEALEDQLGRL
jgi:L-ribulokinase